MRMRWWVVGVGSVVGGNQNRKPGAIARHKKQQQPNMVVLLIDDLSPDMVRVFEETEGLQAGRYEAPPTPALARVADAGVAFKTAWAPAMCTPSRVTLMTGKYPSRHGVVHNLAAMASPEEARTHGLLVSALVDAGYRAAMVGKWGIGGGGSIPGDTTRFDDRVQLETAGERGLKAGCSVDATLTHPVTGAQQVFYSRYWRPCYSWNGVFVETKDDDFGPIHVERRFVQYFLSLASGGDDDKEIQRGTGFLTKKPHRRHREGSRDDEVLFPVKRSSGRKRSENVAFGEKPSMPLSALETMHEQRLVADAGTPFFLYWPTVLVHETENRTLPSTSRPDATPAKPDLGPGSTWLARMRDFVKVLDDNVDAMWRLVDLESTLVWILSDNAGAYTGKTAGYERGASILSMVAGAGVRRRGRVQAPYFHDMTDVAPTLIAAAHGRPLLDADGRSMWGFLTDRWSRQRKLKSFVAAEMSGSRLVLTARGHLLEAANQVLGCPDGRLYSTTFKDDTFWLGAGYERRDYDADAVADVARALSAMPEPVSTQKLLDAGLQGFINYHHAERDEHLYTHHWYRRPEWKNETLGSERRRRNRETLSEFAARLRRVRLEKKRNKASTPLIASSSSSPPPKPPPREESTSYSSVTCVGKTATTRTCHYRDVCVAGRGVEYYSEPGTPLLTQARFGVRIRNVNPNVAWRDDTDFESRSWLPTQIQNPVPLLSRRSERAAEAAVLYDYANPASWANVLIDDLWPMYAVVADHIGTTEALRSLEIILARGCDKAPNQTVGDCRVAYQLAKLLTDAPIRHLTSFDRAAKTRCYRHLFVGLAALGPGSGRAQSPSFSLDGRQNGAVARAFFDHLSKRLIKKKPSQPTVVCLVSPRPWHRRVVVNLPEVCTALAANFHRGAVVDVVGLPGRVARVDGALFYDDHGLQIDLASVLAAVRDADLVVAGPAPSSLAAVLALFCRRCRLLALDDPDRDVPLFVAAASWVQRLTYTPRLHHGDRIAHSTISLNASLVLRHYRAAFLDNPRAVSSW